MLEPRRRRLAWRALAERLFPPAPAARITGGRIAAGVAAVLAGALVSLARQGGVGALDTAYDEDARIFLADAAALSPLDSLTASYQGYYHLVPRLLAEIAVLFPAPAAAAVLAVLAALVTSLLALFVFVAARAHLPYWPLRLVAAAPVVTLPLAQDEIPNAVCNLHWPLLYATVWALLWVPARISGRVVAVVVVAATVTSDLLALAFLPLAAAPAGRPPRPAHGSAGGSPLRRAGGPVRRAGVQRQPAQSRGAEVRSGVGAAPVRAAPGAAVPGRAAVHRR